MLRLRIVNEDVAAVLAGPCHHFASPKVVLGSLIIRKKGLSMLARCQPDRFISGAFLYGLSALIGGSDARIIMGDDEAALLRLWREKRGEVEPEDSRAT